MKDILTDELSNGISEDRALEFDFGMRAPIRRLVVQLIDKNWSYEDIALAFREIAAELEDRPDFSSKHRPHS